jgi:PucR-like helix-turn-helix protein/diguanylate cyclase with GGDEF domain
LIEQARADLSVRLNARRPEIEQAVGARVQAVADLTGTGDPEYVEGLRAAVAATVSYCLSAVERGEDRLGPIPPALLVQARHAARSGVSLDTVLRRCLAGYTLLGDFITQEAEDCNLLRGAALRPVQRDQAALLDRLLVAVTDDYTCEAKGRPLSPHDRHAECVERLLVGELVDTSELAYEFGAWHLGAIVAGLGMEEAIRSLATELDRRLLLVRHEATVWAWLGGRDSVASTELERVISSSCWPADVSLALGEPGQGLAGWRLTHQQAKAALPIALRSPEILTRYADVALLASMLQDDLLATSLRHLYLSPLARGRDGGTVARETLRAYFAAERNVSSAAAALEVNRNTVTNRLHAIERRLGRPLGACAAEMEAALRLEDLGQPLLPYEAFSYG